MNVKVVWVGWFLILSQVPAQVGRLLQGRAVYPLLSRGCLEMAAGSAPAGDKSRMWDDRTGLQGNLQRRGHTRLQGSKGTTVGEMPTLPVCV